MSSASNPDYLFYYDAFGRRDPFDDVGIILSYVYDTLMALQENSSNTSSVPTQNYLTTQAGEVLAYSATAGSTTTTTVPLHDLIGSTIGLVDSSGNLATNFTYEPFRGGHFERSAEYLSVSVRGDGIRHGTAALSHAHALLQPAAAALLVGRPARLRRRRHESFRLRRERSD